MKQHIPNILTIGRLVFTLLVFLALVGFGKGLLNDTLLAVFAFFGFVLAAVTDFFDGYLARKWQVTSMLGAILDPIADKVLVAGAVVGLCGAGLWQVALPGGLILFREFSVSALREVLAPKGLRLPVTQLAKWKTTFQLIALAAEIALLAWPGLSRLAGPIHGFLWFAAVVTVWTGIEYGLAARRALKEA